MKRNVVWTTFSGGALCVLLIGCGRKTDVGSGGAPPAVRVHLIVGDSFREKMRNSQRNMVENRMRLINALLSRS